MGKEFTIDGSRLELKADTLKPPISDRKLQANRANARRSTGPKTERGKNNSRFNAAKHGILAEAILLRSPEERAKFNWLVQELREAYQSEGGYQEVLVEELAALHFRKERVLRYESGKILEHQREMSECRPSESDVAERRQLIACFKKAAQDVRRCGVLTPQTSDELASLMEKSDFHEFHMRFALAISVDSPDEPAAAIGADEGDGPRPPMSPDDVKRARLAVIAEYLEPLEQQCAAADQGREVQSAITSLPQTRALETILRYESHIDRRMVVLHMMLKSMQGRARAA